MSETDADRFRREAEECRQLAEKAAKPRDREIWLRLASDWTMLAQAAEPCRDCLGSGK